MIYNVLGDIFVSFWEKLPCYDTYSGKGQGAITELQTAGGDGTLLIDAAIHIAEISDVARWEGLLALEDFVKGNESDFAKWLVMLVVDGTDPDPLCEMAINEYWMRASKGVCAMVDYIYLRGMLCIQEGLNGKMLADFLQTLIPIKLRPEYQEKLQINRKY